MDKDLFYKGSYFRDRTYISSNAEQAQSALLNEDKCQYWNQLLGQDIYERLTEYSAGFLHYLKDDPYTVLTYKDSGHSTKGTLWEYLSQEKWTNFDAQADMGFIKTVTFGSFYAPILCYVIEHLKEGLRSGAHDLSVWIEDTVYADFAVGCVNRMQSICARTLIARMHEYKQEGKLQGASSGEEYDYFCQQYAGSKAFILETFQLFPVLYCMVEKTLKCMIDFYIEVVDHFRNDSQVLEERIFGGDEKEPAGEALFTASFAERTQRRTIAKIQGDFADTHNHGRQVLRIGLNDGGGLIYKPHSMENEMLYDHLYDRICDRLGIRSFHYAYVSYPDHSWCAVIQSQTCENRDALARYYERFGVHLFLTYLLGTKDLHFENLIAVGEYPVLVDLEALVNIYDSRGETSAKAQLLGELSRSVLYSGLLPHYHWNQSGTGVDNSAISGKEGQRYPFKVPVIMNDKTSDMRIEYHHPISYKGSNLATVNGEYVNPFLYKDMILKGFLEAYSTVEADKPVFEGYLSQLKRTVSRFLVADTQRYAMALNSSFHPSLLGDGAERETFLNIMWQGRDSDDRAIVDREVDSLLDGDIPLFYYRLDETALYSDGKAIVDHYFEQSAYDCIREKLASLNKEDMERQSDYISLSLEMLDDRKKPYLNRIHTDQIALANTGHSETVKWEAQADQYARHLMQRILQYVVWNQDHTEVSWHTVRFEASESVTWELAPMNLYLYDGLAGMLLLMTAWRQTYSERTERDAKIREIAEALKHMLFAYTDGGLQDHTKLSTKNSGALEGEASILYSYIQLHRMTGCESYLDYAKKHAEILAQLLDTDESHDLLSGNAGAAQVLLVLYQITKEPRYLAWAEHAISVLVKSHVPQEKGIGWITDPDVPPMSGMAHGNAGILMPVLTLWKCTGDRKYEVLAEHIWEYENFLYNPKNKNWDDLRVGREAQDEIGAVSWCHGAPGIMLSRIYAYQLLDDPKWKQRFLKEIYVGYDKLRHYWKRDSWSLCHGNCGNLWMLEQAETFLRETEVSERESLLLKTEVSERETFLLETEVSEGESLLLETEVSERESLLMMKTCLSEEISYLPQERLNPGLFNGYGGIVYYLLSRLNGHIPNILLIK